MKLLVTGGAGFIGFNFIRHILQKYPDYKIVNLDNLTYGGSPENLKLAGGNSNQRSVKGDVGNYDLLNELMKSGIDAVVNFAAETHVDKSFYGSEIFIRTNVLGTQVLLEASLRNNIKKFVQISTDEVYGPIMEGALRETHPVDPASPYAASKTGADVLVQAFHRSFGLPTVITRCCNNYGPHQYPEKLVPRFITWALKDKPAPLHGDGSYIRTWLYVEDHCKAIDRVLHDGRNGEIYHISSGIEKTSLEVAQTILRLLNKPESLINFVPDPIKTRDRRYALNSDKIRDELGWSTEVGFEEGMEKTIDWYVQNNRWA